MNELLTNSGLARETYRIPFGEGVDYVTEPAELFVLLNELNRSLGSGTSPGSGVAWHEAVYSPPSSAEVEDGWGCTSVSPVFLHDLHRKVPFTAYSVDGNVVFRNIKTP
jgi:hypothetical protein